MKFSQTFTTTLLVTSTLLVGCTRHKDSTVVPSADRHPVARPADPTPIPAEATASDDDRAADGFWIFSVI